MSDFVKRRQSVYRLFSCYADGQEGIITTIEVSINPGLPSFDVIGLCDSSIRESRGRIQAALISAGFLMPKGHVTVSISPAYLHKSGSSFDFPIALGMLFASGQIECSPAIKIYAEGELSLTGSVKGTPGSATRLINTAGQYDYVFFPSDECESAQVAGISGYAVTHLYDIREMFITGRILQHQYSIDECNIVNTVPEYPDFSAVKGQEKAMNALLIAASGFHNIVILGSPGCGKTTAGRIIAGILPPLEGKEIGQVYAVKESAGIGNDDGQRLIPSIVRPFRHIQPGLTVPKLIGSIKPLRPGEMALANNGVLFADELCDYRTDIINCMRLPMEERVIRINRDGRQVIYPASFIFVGAGNPCRCGMYYESNRKCKCTPLTRHQYISKIEGPFADRIDIFTEMRSVGADKLQSKVYERNMQLSVELKDKVKSVWDVQQKRYADLGKDTRVFNGTYDDVDPDLLRANREVIDYASAICADQGFSVRGFGKLLRVGRTIADLDERDDMNISDVAQAAMFRLR